MQSILHTLKSNKSASACILMKFVGCSRCHLLCAFFCTDWFHCHHWSSSKTHILYRTAALSIQCGKISCVCLFCCRCTCILKTHSSLWLTDLAGWLAECLWIDSLHNDLFVAIMYHQALYTFFCSLCLALFLYSSLYRSHSLSLLLR